MRRPSEKGEEKTKPRKISERTDEDLPERGIDISPEELTPEIAQVFGERFSNHFLYSDLAYMTPDKMKEIAEFKGNSIYLNIWTINTVVAKELRNFKGKKIYLKHLKFVMGNAANILNEMEARGVELYVSDMARKAMEEAKDSTDYPI